MVEIKILLVDDEDTLLEVSKIYLEKMDEKFHITTVNSAEKALKIINEENYDVIISDYQMPEMNGLELLSEIRENGNDIPFIIFTGKGREEVAIQALNLGADFYLQKGGEAISQFHELINLIEKLYEKKQNEFARRHLLDQQISINQLAVTLGETRDLNRIYKTIFQHIYSIMDADTFVVSFYDKEGEMISPGYALIEGKVLDIQMFPPRPLTHKESEIQSKVIETGNYIYLPDLRKRLQNTDFKINLTADDEDGEYTKSAVFVPMKIGGDTIGVIEVQSYRINAYSQQDIELLSALANVTANTIQNARLFILQQQTNQELLEEKNRTQLYLEIVDVIVTLIDINGNVQMINKRGCNLLGYSEKEIIGKNWFDNFLPESVRNETKKFFKSVLSNKEELTYNVNLILTKEGKIHTISWKNSLLFNNQRKITGILFSGLDITDQKKVEDVIEESEIRYQRIAEIITDALIIIEDNKIKFCNENVLNIFGYSLKELRNIDHLSLYQAEDRDRIKQLIDDTLANNQDQFNFEVWIFSKDKIKKYIKVNYKYHYQNNQIVSTFISIRDTTEQKLAEIALKSSERRYRSTFDSIIDPMHVVNQNLKILLINKSLAIWLSSLGVGNNIVGKTIFEAFPFLNEKVKDEYKQVFLTGKPYISIESDFLDTLEIITETRKIPIFEKNKVVRIITILRDITNEKQIEQQLKESEQKHRILFENSRDGIILYNFNYKIIDCNQQALNYFKIDKTKLLKKKITDFIENEQHIEFMNYQTILREKGAYTFEIEFKNSKNKALSSEVSATVVKIGEVDLIQAVIRDTEHRKIIEREKSQYINDLKFLSDSAMEFLTLSRDEDIFHYIAKKIKDLTKECYIIVAEYNKESKLFEARAIEGISKHLASLVKIFGKNPNELVVPINEEYIEKLSVGKLMKLETNLTELTNGFISKRINKILVEILDLGEMFSCTLIRKEQILGSILIVQKKGYEFQNLEIIQAFISQTSSALLRRAVEMELSSSEERFRNIIDSTPLGIHIYELNDKKELIFIGFNPAADKILKIKHANYIGQPISNIFPAGDKHDIPKIYKKIALKGGIFESEQVNYVDEQIEGVFEVRAFQAKLGTIVAIFQDVSEKKKILDEEKRYFDDLSFLSECAMDLVALSREDNIYEYIGKKVIQIIDNSICCLASYNEDRDIFTIQEIIGLEGINNKIRKVLNADPKGYIIKIPEELKNNITSKETVRIKSGITELINGFVPDEIVTNFVKEMNIKNVYSLPFIQKGKLFGLLIVMMRNGLQLTNTSLIQALVNQVSVALVRRNAENELLESEERYRILVETMNDGLGVDDTEGVFIYVNPKLCEMLGYNADEMMGQKVTSFLDEENILIYQEQSKKLVKLNQSPYELNWVTKARTKLPTLVSPKVIYGADGEFKGSFAVITDISERIRNDEKLKEQQIELQKQRDELESFASTIAHDIRGKMQVISLYNTMSEHEYSNKITESIEEMSSFIEDLLLLAKKGEILGEISDVDLNNLIEPLLEKLRSLSPEITIDYKKLPKIAGDKVKLKQVFENLLMNIIKHAEATEVKIYTEDDKNYHLIIIEDNGKGIPESKKTEIIESWSTKRYSSFGMLIILKIIQAHQGDLIIESEEGKGTKISIYLPKKVK
ncbi:MAG: PAS domain S-box protein [Candidatus Heimdallarchaeota archaeon]|nr:PAS domain S-box protein [Candidatus Heimdallarchaeota archaeon]